MNWAELNHARDELGARSTGKRLTHDTMYTLLDVPKSTYYDWQAAETIPRYAAAHIQSLMLLSKSALLQRIK